MESGHVPEEKKRGDVDPHLKWGTYRVPFRTPSRLRDEHVHTARAPVPSHDRRDNYSGVWRGALIWRDKRVSERRLLIRVVSCQWSVTMLRLVIALALTLGAGTQPTLTQAFVVAPQPQHRLVLSPRARGCSSIPGEIDECVFGDMLFVAAVAHSAARMLSSFFTRRRLYIHAMYDDTKH